MLSNCITGVAEIFDNTEQRRFHVAPKIVPNSKGYSDWFTYVNNPGPRGTVDQNTQGYILSDTGRPLLPVVDDSGDAVYYYEVATDGDFITGELQHGEADRGYVPGQPLLYYPYKVIEIASHLLGDIFAGDPSDDGRGTDFRKNLLTYNPNVQAWLDSDGRLAGNNYNTWTGKYDNPGSQDYFGDRTITDMGMRVDTDSTCSHPTNAFLHLISDIDLTTGNTDIAENMKCGAGQTLTFGETNFLMLNKDDGSAVTTYFVYKLAADPGFKIPSCRCAGRSADGTESVLQSRHSAIAGIPNSVFAAAFFCAVLILTAVEQPRMALPLAAAAVAVSIYMSYVMLVRVRSLCAICVNITALGALILWQLLG